MQPTNEAKRISPVARELRALDVSLENREVERSCRTASIDEIHASRNLATENFVANVIGTSGVKLVTRLRGLRALVDHGLDVSTGQFDLFALVVDGWNVDGGFARLEKPEALIAEIRERNRIAGFELSGDLHAPGF